MKNVIVIVALISVIFSFSASAEAATAVGKAPAGAVGAQARVMARRAAQVIAIKNNWGKVPQVISEKWDDATGTYTIEY